MPYINQARRYTLQYNPDEAETSGELNFVLTKCCLDYVDNNGASYQVFNDILGALAGCGKEFYRRVMVPYEDKKIEENGDVYDGFEQQTKTTEQTT